MRFPLGRVERGSAVMRRAGWVVVALAAAFLGGCGSDDPVEPKRPPTPTYPPRTSPQHVLEALALSYVNRDSTEYNSLYDSTYVGTSTDLNDPPDTQVSTFRYADEAAHIGTLARLTTITSVFLDLGPVTSWTRLASDDPSHPEWAMIQIPYSHGQIYDGATLYEFLTSNPMTFAFRPNVPTPGDTTWTIIRWNEVANSSP